MALLGMQFDDVTGEVIVTNPGSGTQNVTVNNCVRMRLGKLAIVSAYVTITNTITDAQSAPLLYLDIPPKGEGLTPSLLGEFAGNNLGGLVYLKRFGNNYYATQRVASTLQSGQVIAMIFAYETDS